MFSFEIRGLALQSRHSTRSLSTRTHDNCQPARRRQMCPRRPRELRQGRKRPLCRAPRRCKSVPARSSGWMWTWCRRRLRWPIPWTGWWRGEPHNQYVIGYRPKDLTRDGR